MREYTCVVCGKAGTTTNCGQILKTCSDECRRIHKNRTQVAWSDRRRPARFCIVCGQRLRKQQQLYCSPECRWLAYTKDPEPEARRERKRQILRAHLRRARLACRWCGKKYKPTGLCQGYCGLECRELARNARRRAKYAEVEGQAPKAVRRGQCRVCGAAFEQHGAGRNRLACPGKCRRQVEAVRRQVQQAIGRRP
jgi:predicted nucleic acid-binding Zn ribbon protein